MAGKKPGRAPKGGIRRPVRFPDEQLAHYEELAEASGLSFSDWVANRVALAEGLAEPYPAPKRPDQQLPFEMAA